MDIKREDRPHGVFKFSIAIPWEEVKVTKDKVVAEIAGGSKVKGFRQGHAPVSLVEPSLDENLVYSRVLNHLVPEILEKLQREHPLEIVNQPKLQIIKLANNEPAELLITLITAPSVDLGDWRTELKTTTPVKKEDALKQVVAAAKVELAEELINEEKDRMLERLASQLQRLNLELSGYLSSQRKTIEDLKTEYRKQAEDSLKTHFVLNELVNQEKIVVTEEEIAAAIKAAPDAKTEKVLADPAQKWYIRSILARSKALELIYAHINTDRH
jgi:FKBP-type peptidyl-prolyl cis-trans isomerase (trigger factor)